jgi:hypothetical protein
MKRKRSSRGRRKLGAGQRGPSKAKSRPRVQTDAVLREDDAIDSQATQSGDTQGLSGVPDATLESVSELVEQGQYFEADAVDGVENAPGSDAGPVKAKEVPEDDVPAEYRVPDRERRS